MALLKQSTNRNRAILLIDSADHLTGKTGLTSGDMTIRLSKDGGSQAVITPTVTEIARGKYKLALTTAHTDTLGDFLLDIAATGCDPADYEDEVVVDLPGATIASVTGAVGSVTGAVASVTGAVGSVTGDVNGNVVGNVNGTVALSAAGLAAVHNWTAGAETYAADGAVPTPFQLLIMIWAAIANASKSGATITVQKLDGTTPAMTFTLNDPTTPTSVTRAS